MTDSAEALPLGRRAPDEPLVKVAGTGHDDPMRGACRELLRDVVPRLDRTGVPDSRFPDSRGEFWARCPFHADQHPTNFSVSLRGYHCFTCRASGSLESLARTLGIIPTENWSGARDSRGRERRIVEIYDYQDLEGRLLSQVVRYEPKAFRQRRPDGRDGWVWNLDGVPKVLYRLPELVKAEVDRPVYIAEGEKAVERLRREELVATTNPGGAGRWREEFGIHFEGRTVVVLPDNDEAGRRHAGQVAGTLQAMAAEVKVVELAGLAEGDDICDWLDAGGTLEELERLVEEAPAWQPSEADEARCDQVTGTKQDGSSSLATWLVGAAEAAGVLLFHDQDQEAYAAIHGDGRLVLRISSRQFHRWLARLAWTELRAAPPGETLRTAVRVLEGKALFEGPKHELSVRVAWDGTDLWYDLADGRAVRVDGHGWEVVERPPILFKRLTHQLAQVEPVAEGRVEELLSFINLRCEEDTSGG